MCKFSIMPWDGMWLVMNLHVQADNQRPEENTSRKKTPSHQHRTVWLDLDLEQILVLISQSAAQHHRPLAISVCLSLQMWLSHLPVPRKFLFQGTWRAYGLSRLVLALFTSSSLNLGGAFNLRFGWLRNNQEKSPGFLYSSIMFLKDVQSPQHHFFPPQNFL